MEHMFERAGVEVRRADQLGDSAATSALLREVACLDGRDLDDADLISAVDALERVKAACAAAQARLTARFVESQAHTATRLRAEAEACSDAGDFDGWVAARDRARTLELEPVPSETPGRRRRPSRSDRRTTLSRMGVSAQVGLARRESPSRGARLANASVALVQHLHHTLEALGAGVLNERRAEIVVRCTSHLDPELRTKVDSEVIGAHLDLSDPTAPGGVGSWGDRELERRLRACADRLDATAAVERCRIAEGERRVTIRPVPDAMALVTALLPVAQAVAVHAALTRAALSGKAAGDERGKGQLMADTLVELVTGQSVADDVPVEVQVGITDRAMLAGDETPPTCPATARSRPAGSASSSPRIPRRKRRRRRTPVRPPPRPRVAPDSRAPGRPTPRRGSRLTAAAPTARNRAIPRTSAPRRSGCVDSSPTRPPGPSWRWTAAADCSRQPCAASSSRVTEPAARHGATHPSRTPTTSSRTPTAVRRARPTARASVCAATSSRRSRAGSRRCCTTDSVSPTLARTPCAPRRRPGTATARPLPRCSRCRHLALLGPERTRGRATGRPRSSGSSSTGAPTSRSSSPVDRQSTSFILGARVRTKPSRW